MNFLSDKIKFYTNIIISGAIASAPALYRSDLMKNEKKELLA
jgi:hypothetical protein